MISTITIHSQAIQSLLFLEENGTDFIPANPIELIGDYKEISTFMSCYIQCNMNPLCRTFVSDTTPPRICRLYQGLMETGTVIQSSSLTSRVAGLIYSPWFYDSYNQSCDPQVVSSDRYLVCNNQFWSCPKATYWNGSLCVNQVYYQNACNINEMCRQDVGLQCFCNEKCLCQSMQTWNGTNCVNLTYPNCTPVDPCLVGVWPLDNDTSDQTNQLNGTLIGNSSFVTGYLNQAMNCSITDYVELFYVDFYRRSFTVELWFYQLYQPNNMVLFSECPNTTESHCLHLRIDDSTHLHFGFWYDDSYGSTSIKTDRWYHVAFVYDYNLRQKFIYLDGILQTMVVPFSPAENVYLGKSGPAFIGHMLDTDSFVGYIDHMTITHRAKTANEVLDDASLLAYYSFDCGYTSDSGPNFQHGVGVEQVTVPGRVNDAFLFNSSNAYFQTPAFLAFAIVNQSFSISFWIKPLNLTGILIHLSNQSTGDDWCLPLLGFNPSGYLIAQMPYSQIVGPIIQLNVWTHIVQTFSLTDGLQIYINGTRYNSTSALSLNPPYQPIYVTVANSRLAGISCLWGSLTSDSYTGVIDELRFFNRQINQTEISQLSFVN